MFWYHFLDYFLLVFHLAIVFFNLFGWIWKKTRKANLVLLILTGLSWFGLGIYYGFGYCPFTDWHWQVLDHLGDMPSENSYMQYLFGRVFGLHFGSRLVDTVTLFSYLAALAFSVFVNMKDFLRKKTKKG
jgi:hypothetical protein